MEKYKKLLIILITIGIIQVLLGMVLQGLNHWLVDQAVSGGNLPLIIISSRYWLSPILWIAVSIWIYKDSKKDFIVPWLWAILVLIVQYNGLIIYLLIRLLIDKEKKQLNPKSNQLDEV